MSQQQIADDLFQHFRARLRTVTLDHIDTCKCVDLPSEEIMSMVVAAMISEMMQLVRAGGGDEEAVEEDIVQSCRWHFSEIKRLAAS